MTNSATGNKQTIRSERPLLLFGHHFVRSVSFRITKKKGLTTAGLLSRAQTFFSVAETFRFRATFFSNARCPFDERSRNSGGLPSATAPPPRYTHCRWGPAALRKRITGGQTTNKNNDILQNTDVGLPSAAVRRSLRGPVHQRLVLHDFRLARPPERQPLAVRRREPARRQRSGAARTVR